MTPIISPELDDYIEAHTRPRPALFDELREVTYASMSSPQMQVGRVEGTFLKTLCALVSARRVLELGTFTGFSALCMAEALPEDGELLTLDIDPEATRIARSFFDRSPHGKKIRILLGNALDSLRSLPAGPPFDLVFIDADKERYADYYEAVLPLVRKGGLIVGDNTLWSGNVLAPQHPSDHGICRFNDRVNADPRVENVLLSIRDGMMLARKL
ncbi:class I SAM-dependent methyltransferase [Polyangium sp. 6x1]|uniref:O-methyltransferase n=1 Tax=Polyangium sp. 6x1 TaxID=3042689 RepID=UPI002482C36D|nr:class I SAM-dependent methyltransferase [Polyangium sp. 6x1]